MKYFKAGQHNRKAVSWHQRLAALWGKERGKYRHYFVCFAILSFSICMGVNASAQTVTLDVKQSPLRKVLDEISKQSGYPATYNSVHFKDTKPVSINLKNATLNAALDACFKDQPVSYEIVDKTIVVKRKSKGIIDKVTNFMKSFTLHGKVTNEAGSPIEGVNIRLKGTTDKTNSLKDGHFSIEAPEGTATLQFSYVGYETVEKEVSDQAEITVTLKMASNQLDELSVVSTGYQNIPKERATGSFVQIDNQLINRSVSTNIFDRMKSIAPGVFFNGTASSNIATISNNRNNGITIRGQNSFSATTAQPLIVVDNFPYEGEVSNINPNDVENITILKDAAAASIWGARSGNGVIVITTKKGVKSQKMKVEVNSSITIVDKPNLFYDKGFLNASSYIEVEKTLFDAGFFNSDVSNKSSRPTVSPAVEIFAKQKAGTISAADAMTQLDVLKSNDVRNDYEKYIYRKAVNQQYSLGIRGGSETITYAISAGIDKNLSSLIENTYDRITLNSTNTFNPLKNLDLLASINYSQNKTAENNDFAYKQYTSTGSTKYNFLYPYTKLADEMGNPLAVDNSIRMSYLNEMENKGLLDWHYRPLADIRNNDNAIKINDLLLRFSAKYKILPQLGVEMLYQSERQLIDRRNLKSQDTYYTRNLINRYSQIDPVTNKITYIFPLGGILNQGRYDWKSNNARAQLNYGQEFGKHEINAIAGGEVRELYSEGFNRLSYGYNDQYGTSVSALDYLTNYPTLPSGSARITSLPSDMTGFTNRYISYFANAGYTYNNKYTLTVSARNDGANLFGVKTNDRITPLWSTGVKWDIDKESFYYSKLLQQLRLRASYGYNGNVNRNGTAFLTGSYITDPNTSAQIIYGTSAPNPQLRWEKIKIINLGLDFASKNNIITGTIEWFYKRGFDLLQPTILAPQTGFSTYQANTADSRSTGFDLNIQSHNLKGKVEWNSTLLLSTIKDKVLRYDSPLTSNSISSSAYYKGYPMFSVFSYKWAGLNGANGNPQGFLNGKISEDYAAIRNNYQPDSLVFEGSARPTVFGAIRNDFSYQGFTLSVNIAYNFGYVFRRNTTSLNYRDVLIMGQHQDYNRRWQKPGDEQTTNVPSLVYPNNSDRNTFYQNSEAIIEKGDHIRLQDIRLAYSFSKIMLSKLSIQRLQLYTYASNLGLIWKKNKAGIDPDAVYFPQPFSLSFGLLVNL